MNTLLVRTQMAQDCEGNHEALPSWLSRLAHDNGYRSFGSLRTCEQLKVPQRHSLDTLDDDMLASIAGLTMSTPAEVAALTLREAMCIITGSPDGAQGIGVARGRWLLKVPPSMRGPRYAVCCACLASDTRPFFRNHWRLSNACWCPIHRQCLVDECPACATPIALSDSREAQLRFCGTCGHDLTSKIAATCEVPSADWLTANPARITSRDMPVPVAFPHLWWDGIRVLLELACRPKEAVRFLKVTSAESSQDALEHITTRPRMDFDKQPAMVRQGLLKMMDELVQEWPHRFADRMSSAGFTWGLFGSTELKTPYWLDTACAGSLYRKRYSATEGESRAAIALLRRTQEATSKRSVKALLGITESKALDSTVWPIQKDLTLAQLSGAIRYLAAEVRAADEARAQQASGLRDACCIALAVWRGISFERAAKLPVKVGQATLDTWAEHRPSGDERDFIMSQFAQWMLLYLKGVRPRFQRLAPPSMALFLTRFGEDYKGFGVAAAFARALRHAGVADWQRGARLLVGNALTAMQDERPDGR